MNVLCDPSNHNCLFVYKALAVFLVFLSAVFFFLIAKLNVSRKPLSNELSVERKGFAYIVAVFFLMMATFLWFWS